VAFALVFAVMCVFLATKFNSIYFYPVASKRGTKRGHDNTPKSATPTIIDNKPKEKSSNYLLINSRTKCIVGKIFYHFFH
jgi:hypothetical protein